MLTALHSSSPSSVTVEWDYPTEHQVSYFHLLTSYEGPCEERMNIISTNMVPSTERRFRVDSLHPNSNYTLTLSAVNSAGSAAVQSQIVMTLTSGT